MKKLLTSAFSTKALQDQEQIIQRCIDEFVVKVGAKGKREKGINITEWAEMVAFDILGEMAFGQTFDCVKNGRLELHSGPSNWKC